MNCKTLCLISDTALISIADNPNYAAETVGSNDNKKKKTNDETRRSREKQEIW
jgi:hypothetical protein